MRELIRLLAKALRDAGHDVDEGTSSLGVDIGEVHYDIDIAETE